MSQILFGGAGAHDLNTSSTRAWSLTAGTRDISADIDQVISTPGKIKNLRVHLNDPPGVGASYTFTLGTPGATALTCTITGAVQTDNQDLVNEVVVAEGVKVRMTTTPAGTPTARRGYWTVEFVPDTADETLILGNTMLEDWGIDYYCPLSSGLDIWAYHLEDRVERIIPTPGTIKNLFVEVEDYRWSGGETWTYILRKNGQDTALTCTVSYPSDNANDIVNSVVVAAGDRVCLRIDGDGNGMAEAYHGLTFVPDTSGESILLGSMAYTKDDTLTEFAHLIPAHHLNVGYSWSTTESDKQLLGQASTFRNLYVGVTVAPGGGNSFVYTLMVNGSPTSLTCTISGGEKVANITGTDVEIADDDLLSLRVEPVGTPNTSGIHRWGLVSYYVSTGGLTVSPISITSDEAFGSHTVINTVGWGNWLELTI